MLQYLKIVSKVCASGAGAAWEGVQSQSPVGRHQG